MDKLSYGDDIVVDFETLPEASQHALAQRGFTHVLGNEVASRVHSWAQGEGQANSEDRETAKAWKAANATAIESKTAEVTKTMLAAIADGTLGTRSAAGPRLQPVDAIKRRLAKEEIANVLGGKGVKFPKKDEKIKTPQGEFTGDELIARRLAHAEYGPSLAKRAEKELAAKAKALAAAKEQDLTADL